MTISGFSFIRNGVLFDYPFLESIRSLLPLCDEFVIAVGQSEDDTLDRIRSLNDSKIKIIETVWDDSLRAGGTILARQTDIALNHTSGDWAFYLQGDEVLHEKSLPTIHDALKQYHSERSVEGLLLNFIHFYGSYKYVGDSRKWYRREIRVVRNGIGARSWRDAQGFRIGDRKLRVKHVDASIHHYGWVKPPIIQLQKQKRFNRLWHSDVWVSEHLPRGEQFDYSTGGRLTLFVGTHPNVMNYRVQSQNWTFSYDPGNVKQSTKDTLLDWIEDKTGYRVAEYRNYVVI